MNIASSKTLYYFARSLFDPIDGVFEVLDNKEHPEYENLIIDIENINIKDLELFEKKNKYGHFLGYRDDKQLEKKAYYIASFLQKEIANTRIEELYNFHILPAPYNSKKLIKYRLR